MKRAFDCVAALSALLLLAPLFLILATLVRGHLGAPVFFVQTRAGLRGKPFALVKFRSMRHGLDAQGLPLPDDQRLTRFGRLLRASSLDELPQLWNVAKGEMSLVGPRPLLLDYLPLYSPEQARRHDLRPGLTGWAQINGRNALSWEDRFALDLWYVDNRSFRLDLRILWLTLCRVIRRQGISAAGEATMPRFTGAPR